MRWWWDRLLDSDSHVEEALRDQAEKVVQERQEIKGLLANAQRDQHKAEQKLAQAKTASRETEKVVEEIKKEEEKNGLAILFRRGIGGMT